LSKESSFLEIIGLALYNENAFEKTLFFQIPAKGAITFMKSKIGIRPCIDGRWGGVRESLENQTMAMAKAAKALIEENVRYADGTPAEVVISPCTIGGGAESAKCAEYFQEQNVTATLSVTPCWCYGTETMDLDPLTTKAIWGFNGTERPGAVYLAAAMAAHAQRGLPAFAIYGHDVQNSDESGITPDVEEKILRWARCALAVGQLKGRSYVAMGSVAMGIGGSFLDANAMQKYFGIRSEWVDMTEILRRMELGIYDKAEYEKELKWIKGKFHEGKDWNGDPCWGQKYFTRAELDAQWEFVAKQYLIIRDIMLGNQRLDDIGWHEEALGKNAILGGFQGQRQWTDWKPNGDYTEALMSTSFDWNGKKQQRLLATEGDNCNGLAMLFENLLTHCSPLFADVRTYWSPDAVKRAADWDAQGNAKDGFMHLLNSGAAAIDGTGVCVGNGVHCEKPWWEVTDKEIQEMVDATRWEPANRGYFRGGGFSSRWDTRYEMPMTMVRINLVDGLGYDMQIAEGTSVVLPEKVNQVILNRTDRSWPSTYFAPRINGNGHDHGHSFDSVYDVMAAWGANHCAAIYGHVGKDLITLASMLRIPVSLHNVDDADIFRPHSWSAFGTKDLEAADYRACGNYGPLYK
jgi:L-fucose/D-arabinose isomerase